MSNGQLSDPRDYRFDRTPIPILHRLLDQQRLAIEADGGDGYEGRALAIGGQRAAFVQRAVNLDAVVAGAAADVGNRDVVMRAPEERRRGVRRAVAEDVAGDSLAL